MVDGFHRVGAHRRVHGREALLDAVEKDYAGEDELFERMNSAHGSRLAPYDQVRCATIAQRLSIAPERLAAVLSVRPSYVGDLTARRTGTELATRAAIPLKRTI